MKIFKKVLVPYLIFQVLYSVFYYFDGENTKFNLNFFQPNWTLWFLLSLFCWNTLLFVFSIFKWVSSIVATIIDMSTGYFDNVGSFLSLSRTFVFFPYFLLGYLVEPEHLKLIKKVKYTKLIGSLILIGTILLFVMFFPKDAIPWILGNASYSDMGIKALSSGFERGWQYLYTALAIFGFLTMVPTSAFKFTIIGQRTLNIYLFHGFIIKTIETFFSDNSLKLFSNNYLVLITFSLAVCLFLGSHFVKKHTRILFDFKILQKKKRTGIILCRSHYFCQDGDWGLVVRLFFIRAIKEEFIPIITKQIRANTQKRCNRH